jgi:hypothetical protein
MDAHDAANFKQSKRKHNHVREMGFEIRSHVAVLPVSRSCHCIMSSLSIAIFGDRELSGQSANLNGVDKRLPLVTFVGLGTSR